MSQLAVSLTEIIPAHAPKAGGDRFAILGRGLKNASVTFARRGGGLTANPTNVNWGQYDDGDWINGSAPAWTASEDVDVIVQPPAGPAQTISFHFD